MGTQNNVRVGITIGDLNGIGMQVIMKALKRSKALKGFTPVVYGNAKAASFYRKALRMNDFSFNIIKTVDQMQHNKPNLINAWEDEVNITPGKPSTETGKFAVESILKASDDLAAGKIDVLVTAPIDKKTAYGPKFQYNGHTAFFTKYANAEDSLMFLVGEGLRVGVVTDHISIKDVSEAITKEAILSKVKIMNASLVKDFNIPKPKIAVLGLNPHAGDGGLLGDEEIEIIKPAIKDAQANGILAYGPFSADGFFGSGDFKNYDGILAMYHDQGLIPFKALTFGTGVNFTAGLPIVRTSPDHGTAYHMANGHIANPDSFLQSIYLACEVFKNRNNNKELQNNRLEPQRTERKTPHERKES